MKARLSILIVTLLLILPSRVSGIGPDTIFSRPTENHGTSSGLADQ